jgi:hypothetical protein
MAEKTTIKKDNLDKTHFSHRSEPWERLKIAVDELKNINPRLTYGMIMQQIGYKRGSHLSDMIRGEKEITERFLNALQTKFFVNKQWIQTGTGEVFLKPSPPSVHFNLSSFYDPNQVPIDKIIAWLNYLTQDKALRRSQETGKSIEVCLAEIYKELSMIWSS